MIIEDLTLVKAIGKGAFGEVYLTSKQGSKEKFATKRIEKRRFTRNEKAKKYLDNEINILKEINHPNIVKLYDIKDTSQYIYLVTEYCNGGGLSDCLEEYQQKNKNKPFPETIVQYLMKQIVSALSYLHNKKILHRDIKLDNILVNFDNEEDKKNLNMLKAKVKMIDFGFARHLKNEELAFSTLGSPINMDPGILRKLNKMEHSNEYGYDEKADIWSLGTICYEMLIGKCTFEAESMKDLVNKVERGDYLLPATLSEEAVSFLNCMLQYDFKKRFSAEQLSRHKFLNKSIDQFKKININEIKGKYKNKNIKINTKMNQSIWDIFGKASQILIDIGMNEELIPIKRPNTDGGKGDINIKPKPIGPKGHPFVTNPKNLKEEFMKVFELVNDDFIYIEPKLIPIIPGDDPSVINKPSEFCDDNY
jgi:serine/threonine protein kinase